MGAPESAYFCGNGHLVDHVPPKCISEFEYSGEPWPPCETCGSEEVFVDRDPSNSEGIETLRQDPEYDEVERRDHRGNTFFQEIARYDISHLRKEAAEAEKWRLEREERDKKKGATGVVRHIPTGQFFSTLRDDGTDYEGFYPSLKYALKLREKDPMNPWRDALGWYLNPRGDDVLRHLITKAVEAGEFEFVPYECKVTLEGGVTVTRRYLNGILEDTERES